ncbi:MAG: membrane protein insertion efficiency factor YidD [Rhodospirillales bacterium]|nr:membrane protein insertion efficiency factor YidD [Rhodospirillales bacterium]MDH3970375.1 membrane protein insertion efficiency factor YidD [Rhodospirillales bacterium]
MKLVGLILVGLIRVYQLLLSPYLPASCRYHPGCSTYAAQAIVVHGPLRGLWLAVRRIVRCHPWGGMGYDPVPPKAGGEVRQDIVSERRVRPLATRPDRVIWEHSE